MGDFFINFSLTEVRQEQVQKYKEVFIEAVKQAPKIDVALSQYFGDAQAITESKSYQIDINR